MTIRDYLQHIKQWRQQLGMDRLIILILVVTNGLVACLPVHPAKANG